MSNYHAFAPIGQGNPGDVPTLQPDGSVIWEAPAAGASSSVSCRLNDFVSVETSATSPAAEFVISTSNDWVDGQQSDDFTFGGAGLQGVFEYNGAAGRRFLVTVSGAFVPEEIPNQTYQLFFGIAHNDDLVGQNAAVAFDEGVTTATWFSSVFPIVNWVSTSRMLTLSPGDTVRPVWALDEGAGPSSDISLRRMLISIVECGTD